MLPYFLSLLCLGLTSVVDGQRSDVSSRVRLKHEKKNDYVEIDGYRYSERVLFVDMLILWIILYPVYKKCLDQYLRNERIGLVTRSRYSNVLWSLVFNSISILYLTVLRNSSFKQDLMETVIKSYYVHYSGVMIFVDENWFEGLLNFFLTLSIFGISSKSLQSKAIEIFSVHAVHLLILDVFKLGYLKYYTKNKELQKAHPRFPYLYYLSVWSFLCLAHTLLHVISVPFNHLYLRYEELFFPAVLIELRLIFLFLVLFKNVIYPQSWKLWLFPNPSSESLHLKSILNNFRNKRKSAEQTSLKKQIWQTLVCTMVMKKKINRMKKSKQAKAEDLN